MTDACVGLLSWRGRLRSQPVGGPLRKVRSGLPAWAPFAAPAVGCLAHIGISAGENGDAQRRQFHGHCRVRSMRLMASSRAAGRLAPASAAISFSLPSPSASRAIASTSANSWTAANGDANSAASCCPGYGAQECALALEDAHAQQRHRLDAAFRGKTQRIFRFGVPQIGEGRAGAMLLAFSCVLQVACQAWKRAIGE